MYEDSLASKREKHEFYIPFLGKSKRGMEWVKFASKVLRHVEYYTVPQYGDAGDDVVTDLSADDIIPYIQKYAKRQGRGARGRQQEKDDMLKMAHYACLRLSKMEEEDSR